jgi:hypothetical protein
MPISESKISGQQVDAVTGQGKPEDEDIDEKHVIQPELHAARRAGQLQITIKIQSCAQLALASQAPAHLLASFSANLDYTQLQPES